MSTSQFDIPVDRTSGDSVKYSPRAIQAIAGTPDAQPFWVADMDFRSAQGIQQALAKVADSGVYGYPCNTDTEKSFIEWARTWHHWDIDPSLVVATRGLLVSISMLVEIMTKQGEGVIVPTPAYQPFIRITRTTERTLHTHPLIDDGNGSYTFDFPLLEQQCSDGNTTLLILCSPHNPFGKVWSEEEIRHVLDIAGRNGVSVISDEIHADLVYPGKKHIPLNVLGKEYNVQTVTCMAPSKTFNIAGEHMSMTIFKDKELKNQFVALQARRCEQELSLFSLTAGKAAYTHGKEWLEELLGYLQGNVDFIAQYMEKNIPQIRFIRPSASFVGILDCTTLLPRVEADAAAHPELYNPAKSPNGGVMSRFFGQRASVAVNDGTWFGGDEFRGWVRFNFGTQRSAIETALGRLKAAVDALPQA